MPCPLRKCPEFQKCPLFKYFNCEFNCQCEETCKELKQITSKCPFSKEESSVLK